MKLDFQIQKEGATRLVFLLGNWAIKIPAIHHKWHRWENLLHGLLSNMRERDFSRVIRRDKGDTGEFLIRTIFAVHGGWLNIQPRVKPLTEEEWDYWEANKMEEWFEGAKKALSFYPPVERKRSSFGWETYYVTHRSRLFFVPDTKVARERIVAIDMGTCDMMEP